VHAAVNSTLSTLVSRLENPILADANVIRWGCPVPSFGDLSKSVIATLGLNPSNREFVDINGDELDGQSRRFHTLRSLDLEQWTDAKSKHIRLILEACYLYFSRNPYDQWFRRLDHIILGADASFYGGKYGACHLDLIPYATACKWTELTTMQRSTLLDVAGDTLGLLLRESPVRVLVLNGNSVVAHFQDITGTRLEKTRMPSWALPRKAEADVAGYAYAGTVRDIAGVTLKHEILVLGFNHNIQSSFGVTRRVCDSIRQWIAKMTNRVM
jgi:hypothetical protein